MRETKFRAKSIKTNKFIYGSYLYLGSGLHYIIPILNYYPIGKTNYTKYQIDPETLGQFTGLKDKNGKEIYKGDIVKYNDDAGNKQIGVVKDYGYLKFYIEAVGGDDEGNQDMELHIDYVSNYEVIGNKFENPELLK